MNNKKLTFFVKITGNINAACRCLNSIGRQTVKDYEIRAYVYDSEIKASLKEKYPDVRFFVVENDKKFEELFNSGLKEIADGYCMLVEGNSVVAVDAAEEILKHEEDFIVFNISKMNAVNKFGKYYSNATLTDEASYIGAVQSVWAFAAKPSFLIEKDIRFRGFKYPLQALFMLLCLALADATFFIRKSFVYRLAVPAAKPIDGDFYRRNCADIRRALRAFTLKGKNKARAEAVRVFALAEIEEIYALPLVQKIRRIYALIKTIWF